MNECFLLTWAKENDDTAVAFAPEGTPPSHELIAKLEGVSELPFSLCLREGGPQDYLANSLAWPMMSEKMKAVVVGNLKGTECISWISAIINIAGRRVAYNIPRFQNKLDVLDFDKTKYVPGTDHIMKPVFSFEKMKNYSFFTMPSMFWQITPSIYVDKGMKAALKAAALSGLDFESAAAA